jgi:hypothetical protein
MALSHQLQQKDVQELLSMIEKAQLKILQGNYRKDQYSLALQENDFRDRDIACHYPIGMPNVFVDHLNDIEKYRYSKWLGDCGINYMCTVIYREIDQILVKNKHGKILTLLVSIVTIRILNILLSSAGTKPSFFMSSLMSSQLWDSILKGQGCYYRSYK